MQETKERYFIFIEKLESKLKEFAEAAIPELIELNNSDEDEYKGGYHRLKSAVLGQIETIRKKVNDVTEEKIHNYQSDLDDHETRKKFLSFRNECYDRHEKLNQLCQHYTQRIEETFSEDLESKYQEILDEHEQIKNKFTCVQCGSPIVIDKIYFTTTYIVCPACQSQNTFEPSTLAKQLEYLGRSLAEQRTAHLNKAHSEIPEKAHQLYIQQHELTISLIHEKDKKVIAEKEALIQSLKKQQQALEESRPVLYQVYLRAMFDEWNKISPDLKEEHERFYNSLLTGYNK